MSLTSGNIANVAKRYQRFITRIVAFDPITWTLSAEATGAITWKPFCLLSPRYAFTSIGGTVSIYPTDSYLRPTTGDGTFVFSKIAGAGSVSYNAITKIALVTAGAGITKIKCVATIGGQTADGYCYVYGGAAGNLDGAISDVDFSGSLDNGGWEGTITLKGSYTNELADDGRDQPILIHTQMYWDGVEDNFGGYKRHQNTFILICKRSELYQSYGDFYTKLYLATPEYILDLMYLGEMKYQVDAAAGYYSTADLTPTDVAYHILRYRTNYGEEFNVSLWNNASTITNFTVREGNSVWAAIRECHEYNFGILWMNRWGNLNGKPSPQGRYAEWAAIIAKVYDAGNGGALPIANIMNYTLFRKHEDEYREVELQAVSPSMAILTALGTARSVGPSLGRRVKLESLICEDAETLLAWAREYATCLDNVYEIDLTMALGHELEIGSEFDLPEQIPHDIGENHDMETANWLVKDVSYQWDFGLGQWTRSIHVTKLRLWSQE